LLNLSHLLIGMDMQRQVMRMTVVRDGTKPGFGYGSNGMWCDADGNSCDAQSLDSFKKGLN
jgi:hypothetical protein